MHPKVSYLACHCAPGSRQSCWGVRGLETFLALPKPQIFAVLNEATPRGLPLTTALLKSRIDIGAENMSSQGQWLSLDLSWRSPFQFRF